MKTSATNRKIRNILSAISNGKLILRAEFQRRLVWTNKHKNALLRTVLQAYPFPEIFIVTQECDENTAESIEAVVDGQQRLTTLYEYFTNDDELELEQDIPAFADLSKEEKQTFLEYEVVVRDLGIISYEETVEVFKRLNSTNYSLTSMEVNNALYDGLFKETCLCIAEEPFFLQNNIFTTNEIRRMKDVLFCANIITTILCGYYTNDKRVEECLKRYNEEFAEQNQIVEGIKTVIQVISTLNITSNRYLQKADLFTLIVELYKAIIERKKELDLISLEKDLNDFYKEIDSIDLESEEKIDIEMREYKFAAIQGTNNRKSRLTRGAKIEKIIYCNCK